ncbi:glyoxalase, partial [Burkholderia seminalis]|nr:glyoxalase [Burkholderia seminalis]
MKTIRSVLLAAMIAGGLAVAPVAFAKTPVAKAAATPAVAVGPQYDTTHVCVAPEDFDRFTDSFVATFGGKKSKQGVFQVTPTPSQTMSQLVLTP